LWGAIKFLWSTTWHAMVVWAVLAPFATAVIYFALVLILRRVLRRPGAPLPPVAGGTA
jgi:hypothetical protein